MKIVFKKPVAKLLGDQRGWFASIDPGLGGTGYAIWDRKDFARLVPPKVSGWIFPSIDKEWPDAVAEIGYQMSNILRLHCVHEVFIELPQLMRSAAGAAAASSGDLVKLSMAAGSVVGSLNPSWSKTTMVDIAKWKGQVSKAETERRVRELLPRYRFSCDKPPSHEIDAVGIGLHVKGRL